MKKLSFILFYAILTYSSSAQNAYVIQIGVFKDNNLNLNSKKFEPINYFGIVFPEKEINGITRVFLKDFKGYFTNLDNTKKVLKKVRKEFRDAFIKQINGNNVFQQPNLQVTEKEILVSFKINDLKNSNSNIVVTPKSYNNTTITEYRLYLGCWDKQKAWQVQNLLPQKFKGVNYKLMTSTPDRKEIDCNKYYFVYNDKQKALNDLQILNKEITDAALMERERDEEGIFRDKPIK